MTAARVGGAGGHADGDVQTFVACLLQPDSAERSESLFGCVDACDARLVGGIDREDGTGRHEQFPAIGTAAHLER